MSNDIAEGTLERSTASESVKTASTVRPTECEIAIVAYLLWLANGCPDGTDRQDWLQAEAMLNAALAAHSESQSQSPSSPCRDTRSGYEILAEFRLEGHWEVWESEWGGARWVCDSGPMVV
jgi:hypothetical protein